MHVDDYDVLDWHFDPIFNPVKLAHPSGDDEKSEHGVVKSTQLLPSVLHEDRYA